MSPRSSTWIGQSTKLMANIILLLLHCQVYFNPNTIPEIFGIISLRLLTPMASNGTPGLIFHGFLIPVWPTYTPLQNNIYIVIPEHHWRNNNYGVFHLCQYVFRGKPKQSERWP